MAKKDKREIVKNKGHKAQFNLIGKAKVTDKTFKIDSTYESGWTDSQMYLGVDCGNGNLVYAELRGGYFPDKDNSIRCYGKDKGNDGKSKQVNIDWDDRLDESLFDEISDSSFITVGIEKDTKGKTVYKKFLSAYDAVEYADEHLSNDTVVNVRGNLKYSEYEGNVTIKKEITSIALSKVEDENDFKATFSQTILIDNNSIGKTDKEKGVKYIDGYVLDYVGSPKIDGKKTEIKKNIIYPIAFEVEVNNENAEIVSKMLTRYFKIIKKDTVNEITVQGKIVESSSIVNVTEDDIPDDIKELMEMGLYSEEEGMAKCAVGNKSRERRMIIIRPDISYVGEGEDKKPTVLIEEGRYLSSDLYFYEQALLDAGVDTENSEKKSSDENTETESNSDDDDLLAMLDNL